MTNHLSIERTHSPSDDHQTNNSSSHSQDAAFAEDVTIVKNALSKDVAARNTTKMITRKASAENLPRTVQRGRTRTTREG
ncbi:hypothetical protein ACTXT7_015639 [Hymenolepis weldensis]